MRDVKDYHKKNIKRIRRIYKKKKSPNYKKIIPGFIKILFSVSLVSGMTYCSYLGAQYFARTPYLNIRQIKTGGLEKLSEDKIMGIINLNPDINILTVKLRNISSRLKSHPWIEEADVRREFPPGILIKIKERRPVAIVNREGLNYLDDKGTIFAGVIAGDSLDFPIFTGFDLADLKENRAGLGQELRNGLKLLKIIEREKVFSAGNVSEINREKDGGFTIFTSNNALQIKIGNDNFSDKIRRLKHVLSDLKSGGTYKHVECINLHYRDRVVVRLKKESSL